MWVKNKQNPHGYDISARRGLLCATNLKVEILTECYFIEWALAIAVVAQISQRMDLVLQEWIFAMAYIIAVYYIRPVIECRFYWLSSVVEVVVTLGWLAFAFVVAARNWLVDFWMFCKSNWEFIRFVVSCDASGFLFFFAPLTRRTSFFLPVDF